MTERWKKCKVCQGSGESRWYDKLLDLEPTGECKACDGQGYVGGGLDFPAYVEEHNSYCREVLEEIDKEQGK